MIDPTLVNIITGEFRVFNSDKPEIKQSYMKHLFRELIHMLLVSSTEYLYDYCIYAYWRDKEKLHKFTEELISSMVDDGKRRKLTLPKYVLSDGKKRKQPPPRVMDYIEYETCGDSTDIYISLRTYSGFHDNLHEDIHFKLSILRVEEGFNFSYTWKNVSNNIHLISSTFAVINKMYYWGKLNIKVGILPETEYAEAFVSFLSK